MGTIVEKHIVGIISKYANIPIDEITDRSLLREDLGFDSMVVVEMLFEIESLLGASVQDEWLQKCQTVGDVVEAVKKDYPQLISKLTDNAFSEPREGKDNIQTKRASMPRSIIYESNGLRSTSNLKMPRQFFSADQLHINNRRAYLRLQRNIELNIQREGAKYSVEISYSGKTYNVSPAGCSITTKTTLPPFQRTVINFYSNKHSKSIPFRAEIKWRNDKDARYGLEFHNPDGNSWNVLNKLLTMSPLFTGERRYKERRENNGFKFSEGGKGGNGGIARLIGQDRRMSLRRLIDNQSLKEQAGETSQETPAVPSDFLPRLQQPDYTRDSAESRRDWLSCLTDSEFKHISVFSDDPKDMRGNIENMIGVVQEPLGIAGPLKVNGDHAQGIFYIPMATTEGALVYTYTKGMQLASLAGGINVHILKDEINISPIFIFESTLKAKQFVVWLESNFLTIKKEAEKTTQYGKLIRLEPVILNRNVVVKFIYTTGDAMGLNIINFATEEACKFIVSTVKPEEFYIRSNFTSVKKVSAHNYVNAGFGKTVVADAVIPKDLLLKFYSVTPERMSRYCQLAFLSSTHAGMVGMNAHCANGLTAIFIACGQDVANVVDSQVSISACEVTASGDLYVSLNIPNLVVGTVGGGVNLGTQRECLDIMDCYGAGKVRKFAEIVAASALAGELAVSAAVVTGTFVAAHKKYGRKPKDQLPRGEV